MLKVSGCNLTLAGECTGLFGEAIAATQLSWPPIGRHPARNWSPIGQLSGQSKWRFLLLQSGQGARAVVSAFPSEGVPHGRSEQTAQIRPLGG